jgi:AAA domain
MQITNSSKDNLLVLSKFDLLEKGLNLDLATQSGKDDFEYLLKHVQPDLVFLDSFSAFHTADEKEARAIKPIITFLLSMAHKYNLHISLIHHTRKRAKKEEKMELTMNEVIGSNVPMRFASIIYGVQKREDKITGEPRYTLTTLGSWFKYIKPVVLTINETSDGGVRLGWNTEDVIHANKKEYVVFEIKKLLSDGGGLKRADIIKALSSQISQSTIDRAIAELLEQGKIIRHGNEHSANTTYSLVQPLNNDKYTGKVPDNKGNGSLSSCLSWDGGDDKHTGDDEPMTNSMTNTQSVDTVSVGGHVCQNSVGMQDEETDAAAAKPKPNPSGSSARVEHCDLDIPPRGECRSSKLIVCHLGEGLQPFCKKHSKWCYHADVELGEADHE